MKKIFKKLIKCRACENKKLTKIYQNKPSPIGEAFLKKKNAKSITNKEYPLNLVICNKCKLCQLDIIVDPKILYNNYLYLTSTSLELHDHFKKAATHLISRLNLKTGSKILEIGSNDGSLLNYFKIKGFEVLGIEPAQPATKISRSKGIKTISSFFDNNLANNLKKKQIKYDLIISNNTFANIDKINQWIKQIKLILSKKGSFVFESSYLADVIFNNVFDFIYHEHLSYFSVTAVNNFCKKNDLLLFNIDHIGTKGGSIRYYITKDKTKKINKKIKKYLDQEKKIKLFKRSTYIRLKKRINLAKNNLNRFMKLNSNSNVIGFGASISCITLIYEFELQNKIKFLIDDNKLKQNKFSPGSNIKILSSEKYNFKENDLILILPWRYQNMILDKHKNQFKKAKKILQIWPKFKIIN